MCDERTPKDICGEAINLRAGLKICGFKMFGFAFWHGWKEATTGNTPMSAGYVDKA